MVNPDRLMYMVDDWRDSKPGKVDGRDLILIAVQKERRLSKFWKKSIKNWIYRIAGTKEIVYKEYPASPGVMRMGLKGSFLRNSGNPWHRKSVPMEEYYDMFVANKNRPTYVAWRKRNDFSLIS